MTALFCSSRPLHRAENIKAVWDAYEGPKDFAQVGFGRVTQFPHDVVVTDELLRAARDSQKVVMVGHGYSLGKRYGLDQPESFLAHGNFRKPDFYFATSEKGREDAASSAGIPICRTFAVGMPRIDQWVGACKGAGGTELAECVSYLYAPTFRRPSEGSMPAVDWGMVDDLLEDGEMLYVKRHMLTREPLLCGKFRRVRELSPDIPSLPYVCDCDVLCTDYSTILIDAYLMGRPAVLFCPDSAEYAESRGMYMDYPGSYCSRAVADASALVPALRDARDSGMGEIERRCAEMSAGACDGRATGRAVGLIEFLEGRSDSLPDVFSHMEVGKCCS